MSPLMNQTVVVTGASSGIGLALCGFLQNRGARVIGISRRSSLGPGVQSIQADLTRREQISAAFQQIGQVDALVNCAGVAYLSRIMDGNPADWEEMWRVNVMGLALCCQLVLRHFPADAGRIVNVSSMSGHRVPVTGGFYAPTKFAVRAITDSLRHELKAMDSPVQVASVSPGFVDTPLLDHYFAGREGVLQKTRESIRMLRPEDVAQAILTILEAPSHVEIGDILMRSADQRA
jgi:17beta-estradiol 17-dehydrogenase / 3beta-hydroxysteroid 3-dehydrogenase